MHFSIYSGNNGNVVVLDTTILISLTLLQLAS